MVLRFDHSPSGAGQISVAKFSETDQFIASGMTGIGCEKKCDVRIMLPPGWNFLQTCAQSLRRIESDNARRRNQTARRNVLATIGLAGAAFEPGSAYRSVERIHARTQAETDTFGNPT